jgi:hypothetical protein
VPDADRHIDDDDLERYVLDRLPEERAAAIEEHLLVCEKCQAPKGVPASICWGLGLTAVAPLFWGQSAAHH